MTEQAVRPRGARASGKAAGKSADAFRTISEVSDELDVPQHVLRFWETRFSQVRPMKRGGGRRYYRPDDIELLRRIRDLLYRDGYTIKGVQKLLREGKSEAAAQIAEQPVALGSAGTSAVTAHAAGAPGLAPGGQPAAAAGGRLDPETRRELEGLRRDLVALRDLLRDALKR